MNRQTISSERLAASLGQQSIYLGFAVAFRSVEPSLPAGMGPLLHGEVLLVGMGQERFGMVDVVVPIRRDLVELDGVAAIDGVGAMVELVAMIHSRPS
jgi:hypothetical protein